MNPSSSSSWSAANTQPRFQTRRGQRQDPQTLALLLEQHLASPAPVNGRPFSLGDFTWYKITNPEMSLEIARGTSRVLLIQTPNQVVTHPELLTACTAVLFRVFGHGFEYFMGPDRRNNTVLRVCIRLHPDVTANEEVYAAFIQRAVEADQQAKALAAAPRWNGWSGPSE